MNDNLLNKTMMMQTMMMSMMVMYSPTQRAISV